MKKIFCLFLALVLIISLMFSSLVFASATNGTDVTDEASFLAAISAKASVINIKNGFTISSSTSPEIDFNTTIKGNGNQIILGARLVFSAGVVTVDNLKVERANGNDCYHFKGGSAVTIIGGSMRQYSTSGDNSCLSIHQDFDGVVNVTGGAQMSAARYLIVSETQGTTKGGTINLLNCTFNGTGSGDSVKLRSGQTVNIGNTANGEKTVLNLTGDGFYMNDSASSVINVYDGAEINCANHFSNLNASNTPVINVYGGTITCANRLFMSQQKAIFNVYGGTLKSTSTEDGRIFALRKGSSAVVMGGTFTNGASAPLDPDDSSSLKIAGGSFNFDPRSYLAGNYAATNSNGTYSVALSLGTPVEVGTATDLANAISAKNPYIKITAPIALSSAMVLDYDVYIDGGNNKLTSNQIQSLGNAVVTLKDVNIERDGDVTRFTGNSHITISGGTYNSTTTSFNNGALYVADAYTGRIVVTDDALIKADTVLPFYTGANSSCSGGMVEFIDCTVTGGGEKGTLYARSNIAITIGGGTEGQTATISNTKDKVFFNNESGWGGTLNIKDGAVISQTTGHYAVHLNKTTIFNMTGGQINSKGQGLVVDAQNSFVSISGGKFTTTNEVCVQKNNGALFVSGGDYTSTTEYGAICSANRDDKAGALMIDAANITVNDCPLLKHIGGYYTVVSNANIEQDGTIITISSTGGDLTLDNCQLKSAEATITSESSAAINLTNGTNITSTGAQAISGSATVNKDETSSVNGGGQEPGGGEEPGGQEPGGQEPGGQEPGGQEPLPENATLEEIISRANAGDTITIDKEYTNVPAITIDKDLIFDGIGSIAFAGAGFEVLGADVTFNGDIIVKMAADDKDGNNRLFNLTEGSTLTLNGGTFTGFIRHAPGSTNKINKTIVNEGATLNQKNRYIAEVANGYNEMIINGGKFVGSGSEALLRINDMTAIVKIYGGEFTHSGSGAIVLVGNVGTLEIGDLATNKGPTMIATGNGRVIDFNTGSGISNASANVNINAGTFTQSGSGYNLFFNKKADAPININGGTWTTETLATVYVNDSGAKVNINGGTFETKTTSEQTIWKKNGALTITGGHFIGNGALSIIGTADNTNSGALVIDGTNNPDAIVIDHKGTGAFIEHRAQVELKIINANLSLVGEGPVIEIAKTSTKDVTITSSTLAASQTVLKIADEPKTDSSSVTTLKSSKLMSYFGTAVINPQEWIIKYEENSSVVNNALADHQHTPEWVYDSNYHWQRCSNEFCGAIIGEKMEHTGGTGDCHTQKVCSHPNCGQPYGANDYSNHVSPDGPFVYEDNEDGATHTVLYTCCHTKAKTNQAHSFDENGYCKDCNAYRAYAFKTIEDTKQVILEGQAITFTSVAEFSKFVAVRVDGKTLVKDTDYVVVSGSTKVTLKPEFIKTLTVGVHKLEIISTDGTATTTFGIEVAGSEDAAGGFVEDTSKPGSSAKPGSDATDSNNAGTNGSATNGGTTGSNNIGTSDKTGNANNIMMLILALFVVSVIGITGYVVCNKKSESENN